MYVLCSSKWRCFYRFSNLFSPPTIWLRQSLPIAGLENWRIPLDISGCRPKLHLLAAHLSTGCTQPINNRLFCPLIAKSYVFGAALLLSAHPVSSPTTDKPQASTTVTVSNNLSLEAERASPQKYRPFDAPLLPQFPTV